MKKNNSILSPLEWKWILYDWANSAFATTVVAGFFPLFFKQYWTPHLSATESSQHLGTTHSISGLLLAVCSPILGSLVDRIFSKQKTLFVLTTLATLTTSLLYFIPQGRGIEALIIFGSSQFLFGQCLVVYDALLVEVAQSKNIERVSSFGYAFGYLGGGILFALNVGLFLNFDFFGLGDSAHAVKVNFLTVAVWWFVFSLPLLLQAPSKNDSSNFKLALREIKMTFQNLKNTLKSIQSNKAMFYFLVAYFLYIDGVNTIIAMAVDYGMSIGLSSRDLIKSLLIVQFIGFPSTFLTLKISQWSSPKKTIIICLLVYAGITSFATQMSESQHFLFLAVAIGLVQGGVQALSRSYFAQLIPHGSSGEYFGFFNLLTKFSTIMGPTLMGWTAYYTQSSRLSILVLLVLFIFGGFFLTLSRPDQE